MIIIIKYTKFRVGSVIPIEDSGVNNRTIITAIGIKEAMIQGNLRPHLVCVLSDK
ncbi:hypothetical protein ES703_52682 [subsurface metagenome]